MKSKHWAWLLLPLTGLCLAATPTTKVVGGANVTESYPWMAGLHNYNPVFYQYTVVPFCGGSLIAPGWVLTAAHCFTSPGNGANTPSYSPQASELILRLDSPSLTDDPEHFVSQIIAHPLYGVAGNDNDSDLALIKLANKASVETISVADAALMAQLESSTLLDDVVQIMGWGVYDDEDFNPNNASVGNSPEYLQGVRLDYLPFSKKSCYTAWDGLTDNMICAWEPQPKASSPFGKDACFGDSGGPLLLPQNTQLSSFRNEHPWLLGVTSFGSTNCNSIDRPGIYTRLANFSQWLENTTDNAGDGLVDASALLELPNAVRPMQAFNLVAGITNNSRINDLDSAVFEVTAANTTLVPPSGHGCVAIADGWRCSSASSLSANTKRELTFSATWTGADDQTLEATVHAYDDDHDDYRNANNTITGTANVTALPDPNLTFSILSNRNGEASITVTASNLSALNSVTGATLVISLPADLTVPTTPVGCNAIGTNQLSCPVGTLLPESSRLFNVTLRGQGAFLVPLYLQSGNGDIQPGDTSQSLIIRLTEFGSSGGAMLLLPLLLLYRRRS